MPTNAGIAKNECSLILLSVGSRCSFYITVWCGLIISSTMVDISRLKFDRLILCFLCLFDTLSYQLSTDASSLLSWCIHDGQLLMPQTITCLCLCIDALLMLQLMLWDFLPLPLPKYQNRKHCWTHQKYNGQILSPTWVLWEVGGSWLNFTCSVCSSLEEGTVVEWFGGIFGGWCYWHLQG